MTADRAVLLAIRHGLKAQADPVRAAGQQAYMKSTMPYHGVRNPAIRALCREVFAARPLETFEDWRDTVLAVWRGARFREERYAAIELTGWKRYRQYQVMAALPMYDEMIVTGGWWDYVDDIAVHRLGPMLLGFPGKMRQLLLRWSTDDDMWRRRSAIICQVMARGATDLDLLYACIAPNLEDRDFFIRKAIGWALRAYAWTDPEPVRAYVMANEHRLSGLSRREALKNIG
jgi:3-methyladenine DNA glycosylase AlkD